MSLSDSDLPRPNLVNCCFFETEMENGTQAMKEMSSICTAALVKLICASIKCPYLV